MTIDDYPHVNLAPFVKPKANDLSKKVPHSKRPMGSGPAHVTLRLRGGLPTMRTPRAYRVLEHVMRKAKNHLDMRIGEYSIQSNHVHMLIDSNSEGEASRAMQGFCIRMAKALNKHWHRSGRVFDHRYHLRWIESVPGVRRVVRYVLQNARKHGVPLPVGVPDPYSSARWRSWEDLRDNICRPLRSPPVDRSGVHSMVSLCGLRDSYPISILALPGTRMT